MKKKIESFLFGLLLLGLGFTGGYVTHGAGYRVFEHPPIDEVVDHLAENGLALPAAHEEPVPADLRPLERPDDILRADYDRAGRDVSHWNTQLDELRSRQRERDIRISLLEQRDDPSDDSVLNALRAEQMEIARAIEEVESKRQLALREAERLELILGAHAVVDAGTVTEPSGS